MKLTIIWAATSLRQKIINKALSSNTVNLMKYLIFFHNELTNAIYS